MRSLGAWEWHLHGGEAHPGQRHNGVQEEHSSWA